MLPMVTLIVCSVSVYHRSCSGTEWKMQITNASDTPVKMNAIQYISLTTYATFAKLIILMHLRAVGYIFWLIRSL